MTAITLHSVTLGVFILISFMVFTMSLWVSKDAEILKKCWLDFSYPQINRIQALKNQREAEKRLEFGIFLAEYLHIKVQNLNFLFWFFWLVLNICCFIEGHSAFFYKLDNNAIFIVWMLKFMFSKKATKIDKIPNESKEMPKCSVDLMFTTYLGK